MINDNVYIKVNGRYKPIGRLIDHDYLSDGLWYVRHLNHGKALTNMDHDKTLFRIGGPVQPDMHQYARLEDYVDYITSTEEFSDIYKKGYCLQDLVRMVVGKVFEYNEAKKLSV